MKWNNFACINQGGIYSEAELIKTALPPSICII